LVADDYLLGELEAMVGEHMVVPAIEEVAEPVAEVEEEQDLITRLGNLEYGHGQLVQRVNQASDAKMVHAADRWEQVGAKVELGQQTAAQRDETVAELTQQ
nr:hypothetical protein [Tanacetum cinerariifolium]